MRRRFRERWGMMAVIAVAAAVALGGSALPAQVWADEPTAAEYEELAERLQLLADDERVEAPDFSLPDLEGNTLTLGELRGKVVFLNFWTTW